MVERVGLVEAAARALPDLLGEFEHDGRTGGRFTREIDRFVERAVLDGITRLPPCPSSIVPILKHLRPKLQSVAPPSQASWADQQDCQNVLVEDHSGGFRVAPPPAKFPRLTREPGNQQRASPVQSIYRFDLPWLQSTQRSHRFAKVVAPPLDSGRL